MTKKEFLELTKDVPEDAKILIYDRWENLEYKKDIIQMYKDPSLNIIIIIIH
jgi:hypothetical protein